VQCSVNNKHDIVQAVQQTVNTSDIMTDDYIEDVLAAITSRSAAMPHCHSQHAELLAYYRHAQANSACYRCASNAAADRCFLFRPREIANQCDRPTN